MMAGFRRSENLWERGPCKPPSINATDGAKHLPLVRQSEILQSLAAYPAKSAVRPIIDNFRNANHFFPNVNKFACAVQSPDSQFVACGRPDPVYDDAEIVQPV